MNNEIRNNISLIPLLILVIWGVKVLMIDDDFFLSWSDKLLAIIVLILAAHFMTPEKQKESPKMGEKTEVKKE